MLAMLRKDCYVLRKNAVAMTVFWMVMAGMYALVPGVDGNMFYAIMPAMSSRIAMNAISIDQVCRWDRFVAMTPLRPWQLVLEKYLLAYGVLALMAGSGALACWVSTMGRGSVNIGMVVALVSLNTAMGLPLVYRFGWKKGPAILLSVWGIAAAAILGAARWNYALLQAAFGWMDGVPAPALAAGTAAVLFAINMGSVLLSIRFYSRRQRGMYD
ncbi:MAG: ABC-2 transporter permease [Oscillospiraceae bacterium]|nr:ABC-2 transporter permease [Oscillospiraceae bacterium]